MDDVGPELIKNNLTLIMKKTLKLKFFIYKGLKKYNIFKVQIRYKTFEEIQFWGVNQLYFSVWEKGNYYLNIIFTELNIY